MAPLVVKTYVPVPEASLGTLKRLPPYHSPVKWFETHSAAYIEELFPAPNSQSLVGVTSCEEKCDTILIVTYSRVVQVYKITRREESKTELLCEWKTHYILTSPVVYDKSLENYVGVFHNYWIRVWRKDISLEKVKKYKFHLPILKILPREGKSFLVIFCNGNCIALATGLECCTTFKGRALFRESTSIVDAAPYVNDKNDHVCYLTKDDKDTYIIVNFPLKDGLCNCNAVRTVRVPFKEVKGTSLVASVSETPAVYFLRINGIISKYDVIKKSWKEYNFKQTDPLTRITNHGRRLETALSTAVCMAYMGKGSFFIYGRSYEQSNDARIIVLHLENNFRCNALLPKYSKDARVFSCGQFMICVDPRIRIYEVKREQHRQVLYNHLDGIQLANLVMKHTDMLPILGLSVKSVWRQTGSYRRWPIM